MSMPYSRSRGNAAGSGERRSAARASRQLPSPDRAAGNAGAVAGDARGAADSTLEPAGDGWTLIALVPYDGQEPPATVSDELAQAVWCAVSALWHPSLLARAAGLPRIESVDSPSPPGPREIRVIASGAWRPAPVRLPDAGRGRRDRAPRVGHRPRRLDPPDPGAAGSRRGARRRSRTRR